MVPTMRVLHLTLSVSRGGRRDAIQMLIEHLRPLGVECGLVGLRDRPADAADVAGFVDYQFGLGLSGRPGLRQLLELRRLCRDRGVELIHSHDAASQYVASMLRLVSPALRSVMTHHRTLPLEAAGLKNRLRNLVTLPLAQRVLTGSNDRRDYFLRETGVSPEKVSVIPLGADLSRFHPDPCSRQAIREELGLPPETLVAVAVGHFGPEKGIDQVLEAAGRVASEASGTLWHLVVLGTGPDEQVNAMQELGASRLGKRVTFLGFRDDVPRWLQGGDLMIHAARQEAFGLVVVQAMACGLPVVATAVGGVAETVGDGESGRLVPAGDLAALAGAIRELLVDSATRAHMATMALDRARSHYSGRMCALRHLALYESLLPRRQRGSGAAAQAEDGLHLAPPKAPERAPNPDPPRR
jgi:glycosyltransferase involved in cell wall biosynthesis